MSPLFVTKTEPATWAPGPKTLKEVCSGDWRLVSIQAGNCLTLGLCAFKLSRNCLTPRRKSSKSPAIALAPWPFQVSIYIRFGGTLQPDTVKIYWSCTAAVHGRSSTGSAPPAHGGRVVAVQAGRCTTHAPWAYSTRVVLCLYGRCRGRVHGCRAPRYHDTWAHPVDVPYKWSYKVDGVMNPRGATSSVPSYRTKTGHDRTTTSSAST